jgi:ubiquinone/menaquinone biosynthesis C-methylase UbiE
MRGSSNTHLTRGRYDRLARFYDFLEAPMERSRFAAWRTKLQDRMTGERALEVGVGTEESPLLCTKRKG